MLCQVSPNGIRLEFSVFIPDVTVNKISRPSKVKQKINITNKNWPLDARSHGANMAMRKVLLQITMLKVRNSAHTI